MLESEKGFVYIDQKQLTNTGRVQSVISSKNSSWAVRNVNTGSKGLKTEPHLEAGIGFASENLFKFCYQDNVKSHVFSSEKYLFLLTVCRNPEFPSLLGERVINGYIKKVGYGCRETKDGKKRWFVFGDPFAVGFSDAIPVSSLGLNEYIRVQLIDEKKTNQIMARFSDIPNSTNKYIQEIERLDPLGLTCSLKKGEECLFESTCLRQKPFFKVTS